MWQWQSQCRGQWPWQRMCEEDWDLCFNGRKAIRLTQLPVKLELERKNGQACRFKSRHRSGLKSKPSQEHESPCLLHSQTPGDLLPFYCWGWGWALYCTPATPQPCFLGAPRETWAWEPGEHWEGTATASAQTASALQGKEYLPVLAFLTAHQILQNTCATYLL